MDGNPVSIRLGALDPDGVAPILFGLIARGAERRAALLRGIDGEVELRLAEVPVPLRIAFASGDVVVEDGSTGAADVVIHGRLADLAQLMVSPAIGGVPLPTDPRGRAALGSLATQRVRIEGKRMLARKLLALLAAQ